MTGSAKSSERSRHAMSDFEHIPVLFNQTIEGLAVKSDGVYADGTAGGGSHSRAVGERLSDKGRLICVDRDTEAIGACEKKLSGLKCGLTLLHTDFAKLPEYLRKNGIMLDGLLVDLGVSSHQLDTAERGFSYMADAELDMRMNRDDDFTAKDLVNSYSKEDMERIFFEYGEERYSRSVASAIAEYRKNKPIETTLELAEIIKSAMPAKALREKQHPAKRVFQAIRIEVNDELKQISDLLDGIMPLMNSGGRICVITFHSLEDRIVKTAFAKAQNPCTCPPDFPVCVCGKKSLGKALKPITPDGAEIERNPRSRSSRLRIFVRE